ncbi:hypothetical protein K1719_000831 [Acacia pycnantha]|nr:hypothetical protein K1719_000831 [Acacia pycnantha]
MDGDGMIEEEDLSKMAYLKAMILEGLSRHPPTHFLIPHGVSKDVTLNGYLVPKKGAVNFMVADMGWDPEVWENPMAFKPERFLINSNYEKNIGEDEELFDIKGSGEIKMMPFGVGRRICPGYNLAMLHLGYFVANLIWNFEWKASEDAVDLSENHQFTVTMKNGLEAYIDPSSILVDPGGNGWTIALHKVRSLLDYQFFFPHLQHHHHQPTLLKGQPREQGRGSKLTCNTDFGISVSKTNRKQLCSNLIHDTVLMQLEQEQKIAEDARRNAEQDVAHHH